MDFASVVDFVGSTQFLKVAAAPVAVAVAGEVAARWIARQAEEHFDKAGRSVQDRGWKGGPCVAESCPTAGKTLEIPNELAPESLVRVVEWAVEAIQIPVVGLATVASILSVVPEADEVAMILVIVVFTATLAFIGLGSPAKYDSFRNPSLPTSCGTVLV